MFWFVVFTFMWFGQHSGVPLRLFWLFRFCFAVSLVLVSLVVCVIALNLGGLVWFWCFDFCCLLFVRWV